MTGHRLDLAALARRIEAVRPVPGSVGSLRVVSDEGWSSIALESDDGLMVLVARGEDARPEWARSLRLLSRIAERLPVAVPSPVAFVPGASEDEPALLIYPKLPGRPPTAEEAIGSQMRRIAPALGRFLARLHTVPLGELGDLGLATSERGHAAVLMRVEAELPMLERLLSPEEYARVEVWLEAFRDDARLRDYRAALRHGDAWYGNVLMHGGELSGVIDWEDAAIGDPALDFADQFHLGREFHAAVAAAYRDAGGTYGADEDYRARRWWESRAFQHPGWPIREGKVRPQPEHLADRAGLEAWIERLRASPVLAGWR